jgi:hypothetical protein
MRLTLRTLLAYLDDLLEPAQAKELGAKIQESEVAAELIMKIRDVIRKRRLTAPIVSGPGCDMDANFVAEYLDNTLPTEGVADLEKICLESDTHLAEVAACHQILTLVLGEPVDIGSHSRERMYALAQVAPPKPGSATEQPAEHDAAATASRAKPNAVPIIPATVGLNRKAIHDTDPQRRGDSFIQKSHSGSSAHPSTSPPARQGSGIHAAGQHGQNSALSGVLSGADHAAPAPVSTHKPPVAPHTVAPTGLGPAVKSVSSARPPSSTIPATANAAATSPRNQTAAEPFDRTIPDYLKQPPMWRRALPLAILLLIAVWVGTLLKDKDLLSGLMGKRPETRAVAVAENPEDQSAEKIGQTEQPIKADKTEEPKKEGENPTSLAQNELPSEDNLDQSSPDVMPEKPKGTEVAVIDPAVDAPPPLEEGDSVSPKKPAVPVRTETVPNDPEMTEKSSPASKTKLPKEKDPASPPKSGSPKSGTEVAAIDTPQAGAAGKSAAKPARPGPASAAGADNRPQPVRYVSQEGVALRFDDDRQGWFPLPHREFVFAEDILAIPEPFDAQLQFGAEKHRLTAIGPTLLQIVETMDDLPLAVNVERGRLILQPAEPAAGAMPSRLRLSLNVQGLTWLLELPDLTSRCGIEIVPREPHQMEENFGSQGWSGKLFIVSGTVKVTTPEGKAQIITGPESYVLAPDPTAGPTPPVPSSVLPSWLGERKLSSVAKLNASQFQRTLLLDELSAHDALLSAVNDRVPEKSRLATACLGLIGDYQVMLEVLDRNEHQESRESAIDSLRSWINLNPANREKIKAEITTRFFKDDVEIIYRLLWGYQDQDLRGKQVSRQLVNCLTHDNLAIREFAYHYIKTLTNRRVDYDARGPQTQRNAAIQQLEKVLDKDGSLLPPLPKGAGNTPKRN